MKDCHARQYGDEMKCGRCGLSWDTNDPDPPKCAPKIDRRAIPDRRVTDKARKVDAGPPPIPESIEIGGKTYAYNRREVVRQPDGSAQLVDPLGKYPPVEASHYSAARYDSYGTWFAPQPYPPEWQANGRSAWIPEELPDDLSEAMADAFDGPGAESGTRAERMRAAYKVFLDRVGPG